MSAPCHCHTSLKNFKSLKYVYNVREQKLYLKFKSGDDDRKDNREIDVVEISKTEMDNISEEKLMELFDLSITEIECPFHHNCHQVILYDREGLNLDRLCRSFHKIYIQYVLDR